MNIDIYTCLTFFKGGGGVRKRETGNRSGREGSKAKVEEGL
jgi:hypothetical protein